MGNTYTDSKGYPAYKNTGIRVHNTTKVGKKRKAGQVTHHKDLDKTNFRHSNLTNMSRSKHSKLHAKKKSSWF